MKKLFEVVKVLDVEPVEVGDGETFRFRLEIRRELGSDAYEGRVYRLETYRLQPTFPLSNGVVPDWVNDAMIYVVDEVFDNDALNGNSAYEVVEKFGSAFRHLFSMKLCSYPEDSFDE